MVFLKKRVHRKIFKSALFYLLSKISNNNQFLTFIEKPVSRFRISTSINSWDKTWQKEKNISKKKC